MRNLQSGLLAACVLATNTLASQTYFSTSKTNKPKKEQHDDTYPFLQPTLWDISTDFPHPRRLEYHVSEGTWLRLDVHPKSGDIIFDMAGDVYCLPGDAYTSGDIWASATKATQVLLGVPHDSDPHFSPEGDRVVFRSDAELGVENIWVMPWTSCAQMDVKRADWRGADEDRKMLAEGFGETIERKQRRLAREGRDKGTFIQEIT